MNDEQKIQYMNNAVKPVFELLKKRLTNRSQALDALATAPMDNVPEKIRVMREEEASRIRAVIEELRNLEDSLRAVFPEA